MKTVMAKGRDITHRFYIADAEDQVLGRMASKVAQVLRGKHRPDYTPHMDQGDHVVVVNAEKVRVTGNKEDNKTYFRHSRYPGGGKTRTYREMMDKDPTEVIRLAVKGMLPKNVLGRQLLGKLRVYTGTDHQHTAQQPEPLSAAFGD
jgi:large subunit ribosomal protein L13